jgi:hypothetical protein
LARRRAYQSPSSGHDHYRGSLKLPHAQADLSSPDIRLHQRLRYASRALSSRWRVTGSIECAICADDMLDRVHPTDVFTEIGCRGEG